MAPNDSCLVRLSPLMAHPIDKYDESMAVWPSGNGIRRINEVTLHPTQLVLT